jgi:hypothetical protein
METKMKKEKRVKVVPTREQLNKMVMDYLNCSEKHLFQVKYTWDQEYKDTYYKVLPVIVENKLHYIAITLTPKTVDFYVRDTKWVTTKNDLGIMKNFIFRQDKQHKSVRAYVGKERKFMSNIFYDIRKISEGNPGMSKDEFREKVKARIDLFHKELQAISK